MLPLDEPYFEVDANKREIVVPAAFKKNGVSVEGDEIAESLIFKINRFFDYADLNEWTAVVQWVNAKGDEGVTEAFFVDASEDPNYIFVMWPLTSAITQFPGTIKFSLRFYDKDNGAYNFSTKIASAIINAGYKFTANQLSGAIDAASLFSGAIKNSKNAAAEDAMAPYFLINLNNHRKGLEAGVQENYDYPDTEAEAATAEVIEAYIDPENPTQVLRVEATSSDAGMISYEWKYVDQSRAIRISNPTNEQIYRLTGVEEYIPTKDETPVEHKKYYNSNHEREEFPAEGLAEDQILYERTNAVTISSGMPGTGSEGAVEHIPNVVGKYFAIATNTVGATGNTETNQSKTIVFPGPVKLEFTEAGQLAPNTYLSDGGVQNITTAVEIDERGAKASYEWQYSKTYAGTFSPISGDTSTLDPEDQAKLSVNEDGDTLRIEGLPGYYKVLAKSTRNYETIQKESAITKVTMPLKKPVITYPAVDTAVSSLYNDVTLRIEIEPFAGGDLETEGITYQWFTDDNQPIEGATSKTYVVPRGTRMGYYCVVTNHMGNDVAETRSEDFSVNPIKPEGGNSTTPEENTEG